MEIRAFHRRDREQLTELVNAHIAAVVPGWAVSVSTLLSQLEREPGQYVVGPWVVERVALVGLRRDRVGRRRLSQALRVRCPCHAGPHGAGEIAWMVCLPQAQDVGRHAGFDDVDGRTEIPLAGTLEDVGDPGPRRCPACRCAGRSAT